MRFTAGPMPQGVNLDRAIAMIWDKFAEIESEFYFLAVQRYDAAPNRPQDGQLVFADGTNWNPGSGEGVYVYDATGATWRLLG